jgi:hypothetical protein
MTPEHKLLSFLNEYGVGVFKRINPVLKETFPFTNDDSQYGEFDVHQRQVKDFLNVMDEHKLITFQHKYAHFGSRRNGKNYTLDDVDIVAALTPQGADRLKAVTPPPKQTVWKWMTTHPTLTFWGVVLTLAGIVVSIMLVTCNDSSQGKTSTTQEPTKSKVSTKQPVTPLDTLHTKQ